MFAPADRAFLTTLAQLCAQSLDRARIYAIEHQARLRAEQASERADLLAHMSQLLVSSLDYPATIQKVADLVVPRLADWCVVDILESDGTPTMTAAHRDPAQVRWAFELREIYPIDMSEPVGMPQVIRSGKAELYAEISDDLLQATAKTPEELAILRAVGYRSVMITPLRARGRVLGAVTFVTTETERRYRADDLAFAQDIADRAAVAIDNAMLYSGAQQARETAEAAVQLRDQFLSVAAHELKTPLTSLQLQVQLIQRRAAKAGSGDERDRRALKVMTDQMRRLDRMIGTLLDIARIEHGQLNIAGAPLDLDDLAQRVIAEIQPTTDIHLISYSCIGGPTVVMGDELRLEQVLQNLLQNAIKYSPNGGPIAVELRGDGSAVRLQVSDSGIGVPQAEIPQLFNQFYRAANADVKRISGLGIGLYVVREIIRMHGGAVEATSREGAGSAFSVTLPALAIGIEMETHPGE
jgi:signal transduction histidine kinase